MAVKRWKSCEMIQSWCTGLVKYENTSQSHADWNGTKLAHTCTHEHLRKRANTCEHIRTHANTHGDTHSLSLTHKHTYTHTHSLSHTHTRTHTHTVDGYNIKSRARLAEYVSVRWLHLFFLLFCISSFIRERVLHDPLTPFWRNKKKRHEFWTVVVRERLWH